EAGGERRPGRPVPPVDPGGAHVQRHRDGHLEALLAEQRLDAGCVRVARRSQLAPRAVLRILVLPPAQQLRAVAKAVALDLVVPHLDDELRLHPRLLELARSPTAL